MCLQKHIQAIHINIHTCIHKGCAQISTYIPHMYTMVKGYDYMLTYTHAQHNAEQNKEVYPNLKLEIVCKSVPAVDLFHSNIHDCQ